ncbi:MAG: hypothetical protein IJ564_00435 [Alphaproteobacteria bacterium]|nr:hypothetical protein [Alphaproteobacteria bacterium]
MISALKKFCMMSFALALCACSSMNNNEAMPERFSDLHFDNKAPIELMVKQVDVKSEFTPTFQRPNVEHLFPVSIEKTAKTWAHERLKAVDSASNRTAEFIIQDASVTEREIPAEQFLQKDSLKYHANLKVTLRVIDSKATAQTTVEAYRELTMPVDTNIEDKEMYWNDMVTKLFKAFDEHMQTNTEKYLNMYIKNNSAVTVF